MRYLIYLLLVMNLAYFALHMAAIALEGETAQVLPPLPSDVRSLVTLSDAEPGEPDAESSVISEIDVIMAMPPPGAGLPLNCYVLGPFQATATIEAVEKRLIEIGYEPARRTSDLLSHIGYWVYMPAMDREAAMQVKSKLDENRDKEYFIGKDNYISLGAFKELSRAEIRMKSVRKLGLDPVLDPRYKSRTVHWLDLEGGGEEAVDLEAITMEFPEIELQHLDCQ